jgi:hypothetical protein
MQPARQNEMPFEQRSRPFESRDDFVWLHVFQEV